MMKRKWPHYYVRISCSELLLLFHISLPFLILPAPISISQFPAPFCYWVSHFSPPQFLHGLFPFCLPVSPQGMHSLLLACLQSTSFCWALTSWQVWSHAGWQHRLATIPPSSQNLTSPSISMCLRFLICKTGIMVYSWIINENSPSLM